MTRVQLPSKTTAEIIKPVFNFLSDLPIGETVASAVVTATVYSGTDAAPSGIISGAAAVATPLVTQTIIGGVLGVIYLVLCAATTSAGRVLHQSGFLAVVPTAP